MKFAPVNDDASRSYGYAPGARGIVVVEIEPGSKADQSGIREGDLLKEVNHRPVETEKQYLKIMETVAKGETVSATLPAGKCQLYCCEIDSMIHWK